MKELMTELENQDEIIRRAEECAGALTGLLDALREAKLRPVPGLDRLLPALARVMDASLPPRHESGHEPLDRAAEHHRTVMAALQNCVPHYLRVRKDCLCQDCAPPLWTALEGWEQAFNGYSIELMKYHALRTG